MTKLLRQNHVVYLRHISDKHMYKVSFDFDKKKSWNFRRNEGREIRLAKKILQHSFECDTERDLDVQMST